MGVKDLNVRDRYAAEARDKHVTKLNNVLYIIVVLVKVKTSKYLSKQTKFETKLEVKKKKIHNSYVSFDIVTFAIYGKNNGNMIVGETSDFFSFQNITYAYPPHAVYVPFIYLHIKVSRSPLEPNLST